MVDYGWEICGCLEVLLYVMREWEEGDGVVRKDSEDWGLSL